MKSASITIKDIAKALDLSYSTVSRALQDNYRISEAIRKKVQQYALENNYRPNLQAQSLKMNKSRSIGIILPRIPNNFFAEVINGIESIANERNYHVIITQSHESLEREIKNLEHLTWRSVDGFLVSVSTETKDISHFKKLQNSGIPVVFFDRVPDDPETHKVTSDDRDGSYKLALHLIAQGYTRIAHITSSPYLSISTRRLEGFERALREHQLPINEDYIKYCMHGGRDEAEVETATTELLNMKPPPDAIVTASDRITVKTFAFLKKQSIIIPEQVAIGGFCNFSAPEVFGPALTTVVQPAFEMGKKAIEILLRLIESKKPVKEFTTVTFPCELIVRESTLKL